MRRRYLRPRSGNACTPMCTPIREIFSVSSTANPPQPCGPRAPHSPSNYPGTPMTELTDVLLPAPPITMAQALNQALSDSLAEDETVLVMGEDVGPLGGVFRVTDGLTVKFGEDRVFDTPLAESGIVGTAIGMAMNGLRPVVEMQFDAF